MHFKNSVNSTVIGIGLQFLLVLLKSQFSTAMMRNIISQLSEKQIL